MANHWDTKCSNEGCGHQKGNHRVMAKSKLPYRVKGMPGRPGVNEIGHCCVQFERVNAEYVARTCVCKGFSDGKRWKEWEADTLTVSVYSTFAERYD